jgi:hypothetical protein
VSNLLFSSSIHRVDDFPDSDVIYVNFMGQPVVVLNTAQVAIDLLDKRSNIYSNRPDFHFFEE